MYRAFDLASYLDPDMIAPAIRDPHYVEPVDFRSIPIHIHQIDFSAPAKIASLKPGIHYAVNACADEAGLREIIRGHLAAAVNDENAPPAGIRRGSFFDDGTISADFDLGERDALYRLGINPIIRRLGTLVLWGMLFVDRFGRVEKMVGPADLEDPMRRGRPHPQLYQMETYEGSATISDWISGVDANMGDLKQQVGMILDAHALRAVSPSALAEILTEIGEAITNSSSEPMKLKVEVSYRS